MNTRRLELVLKYPVGNFVCIPCVLWKDVTEMGGFLLQPGQSPPSKAVIIIKNSLFHTPAAIPFLHATTFLPQREPLAIWISDQMGFMFITPIQILWWATGCLWAAPQPGSLTYPLLPAPLIHLVAKTKAVVTAGLCSQLPGLHTCKRKKVTCPRGWLNPSPPAPVTLKQSHCQFGMALEKPTMLPKIQGRNISGTWANFKDEN